MEPTKKNNARTMWRLGIWGIFASSLACAGGGTAELTGYAETVQAWVGQDGNTLVRTWGAPASTFPMPNGNVTYVYVDQTSIDAGKQLQCTESSEQGRVASCWVSGEQVYTFKCQTQFEVDAAQKVVFATAEGTACLVALPPPAVGQPAPPNTTAAPATPSVASTEVTPTPPSAGEEAATLAAPDAQEKSPPTSAAELRAAQREELKAFRKEKKRGRQEKRKAAK